MRTNFSVISLSVTNVGILNDVAGLHSLLLSYVLHARHIGNEFWSPFTIFSVCSLTTDIFFALFSVCGWVR